jgi:RHS repeat-associated protein
LVIENGVKNQVIRTTDPLGRKNQIEYNVGDELIKTTSPDGRVMTYTYDARGQRASVKDPLNGIVNFTYDHRKNLTTLSDHRGNTTTWTYDELYRPTGMRDPLGRASIIESYDANGNVKATIDRLGRRVLINYDVLDRIQMVTYADATVSYQYDAAGRPTRVDDSQSGFAQWSYDSANRVLSETTNNGVVSYGYNDANQRTAMTALNRAAVNYGYDAAGRLSTITQGAEVFTYGYDTLSRRSSLQRLNGVNTSYAYDEVNRLKRLTHANSVGNIEDLQYSYNLNDEISAITSLNSATILPLAKTATPANAANRISQVGTANYQFDNHGQTTSKTDANGTTNYNWDARGRLTKATLPNGQSVDYGFDALGRRASRSYQGTATNFVYDGQDVVADKVGANVATDYLNGAGIDDKLRQSATSTGSLYFLQDHLGSTNALTSAGGGVVERQSYEAFGNHNPSELTRYTYTGREDDAATGLMYYRARWYDGQQGRFVTEDPIGIKGGLNFYSYASNSPTNRRDPSGLIDLGWDSPTGPSIPFSKNTHYTPQSNQPDNCDKEKDISRMTNIFDNYVLDRTVSGRRHPYTPYNNFRRSYDDLKTATGGESTCSYEGCADQAEGLKNVLDEAKKNREFSGDWEFEDGSGEGNEYSLFPWIPRHQFVIAKSKDTYIKLDPWRNQVLMYSGESARRRFNVDRFIRIANPLTPFTPDKKIR